MGGERRGRGGETRGMGGERRGRGVEMRGMCGERSGSSGEMRGMGGERRGRGGGRRGRGRGGRSTAQANRSAIRGRSSSFIGPRTQEETILSSAWRKIESTTSVYSFCGPQPGPVRPIDSSTRAVALFQRFFSDEAIALVIEETNRYAAQCRAQCTSPTPRAWHDITSDELKAFFGMLFYMGIARLPQLQLYGPLSMSWLGKIYLM